MRGVAVRVVVATAAVVALVGVVSPAALSQEPSAVCTPDPAWGTLHPDLGPKLLALLNAYRTSHSLPALTPSPQLTAAAVWKARHMAAYGYLDPSDQAPPVARSFVTRFHACGYTGAVAAENVAEGYPDADSIAADSVSDPGLRANVVNQAFTVAGIAAASDAQGNLYWVTDFGSGPVARPVLRCHVPRLTRRTATAAVQALRRAGCGVGNVSFVTSRTVRRGRVVSQSPRPATTLPLDGKVSFAVSVGRRIRR